MKIFSGRSRKIAIAELILALVLWSFIAYEIVASIGMGVPGYVYAGLHDQNNIAEQLKRNTLVYAVPTLPARNFTLTSSWNKTAVVSIFGVIAEDEQATILASLKSIRLSYYDKMLVQFHKAQGVVVEREVAIE